MITLMVLKKTLRAITRILLSTFFLLFFLEAVFYLAGVPPASNEFVETTVLREKLPVRKLKGEIRVFTYGESTMQGAQYSPISSPGKWLGIYLKEFLPGRNIRRVGFARMGHASYFTYQVFRDTLVYKPDIAIFYLGHNDFLPGERKDEVLAKDNGISFRLGNFVLRSRFVAYFYRLGLARKVKRKLYKGDQIRRENVETPPRGNAGAVVVPGKDPFYWENIEFFKQNLSKIRALAGKHHVTILFFRPVSNLKDFSPSESVHIKSLTPEELAQWEKAYGSGTKAEAAGNRQGALIAYRAAHAIDDTYAELSFRLGQIEFKNGELQKAKELFEEARDHDAVIVRATKDVLAALDDFAKTEDVPLVDMEKLLLSEAPGGIMGHPIIEDNVHLSIKGHAILGRSMAEEIAARNWIAPLAEWRFEREKSYDEILQELGVTKDLLFNAYLDFADYFGSRFESRILFAEKALGVYPDHPLGLRQLAWSCWLKGDREKALSLYHRLKEVHPEALEEVFRNQPEIKKFFG